MRSVRRVAVVWRGAVGIGGSVGIVQVVGHGLSNAERACLIPPSVQYPTLAVADCMLRVTPELRQVAILRESGASQHSAVERHSTARRSTARRNTARYSMAQHGAAQHGTAQHATA